jgi:L-alanine-DL-glutamate epimerase-like enolase superfamily enzyme
MALTVRDPRRATRLDAACGSDLAGLWYCLPRLQSKLAPMEERLPPPMEERPNTWERLAGLPLQIDTYQLEPLQAMVSSDFERKSTVIRLTGAGHEGQGEDVTYDAVDHDILQAAGPNLPLQGSWTIGSFSEQLAALDLFPKEPQREVSRRYRIWAYESAALDLALRQAGTALHAALGREPQPVRFVVSLRLGEPPSMDPLCKRLEIDPSLRFKLDPTSSWSEELITELVETGAVESVDFKGYYSGSVVDQAPDPVLYRRVAEAFPQAWIEDPALTPETDAALEAHRERFSWDALIHSVEDIQALPYPPRMVNIKPSRLGGLRNLLDAFDYCAQRGIGNYGGGQFELGVGRGQIQYFASLFHADAPNDVAPSGYNLPEPPAGLARSPLAPAPSLLGFRWGAEEN